MGKPKVHEVNYFEGILGDGTNSTITEQPGLSTNVEEAPTLGEI